MIEKVASSVKKQFPQVDREDIRQEVWIWALEKDEKVTDYLDGNRRLLGELCRVARLAVVADYPSTRSVNQFANSFPRAFGWKAIFVDGEDADSYRRALTPKTKAILCVHLGGWPCETLEEAQRYWSQALAGVSGASIWRAPSSLLLQLNGASSGLNER